MQNLKTAQKHRQIKQGLQEQINKANKCLVMTENGNGELRVFYDNLNKKDFCYYSVALAKMANIGGTHDKT